jgi:hypothetical protein
MKLILFILLLFINNFLFGQSASKYLKAISTEAKLVQDATWEFSQNLIKDEGKNPDKLENSRYKLLGYIMKSKKRIESMSDFDGKTYFRDSIVIFLKLYEEVVDIDYPNIKKLNIKADKDFELKEKLIFARESANTKLTSASEMLTDVEKRFSMENNLRMSKEVSKTAKKLQKANKVYKYYNSMFLIFFRCYIEEAKFLKALDEGSIEKMRQAKSDLNANLLEYSVKLNLKLDFEGDKSLIGTCQEVFDFYEEEVKSDFKKIIEFQEFKLEFQETKVILEAKTKEERAKGEVAEFNKLVAEYNKRTQEYNDLILNQNAKRESLINSWNLAGEEFEKEHLN